MSGATLGNKDLKPVFFNGGDQTKKGFCTAGDFLEIISARRTGYGWTDSQTDQAIKSAMVGDAATWDHQGHSNFDVFTTQFRVRFGLRKLRPGVLRRRIMLQNQQENVTEYVGRVFYNLQQFYKERMTSDTSDSTSFIRDFRSEMVDTLVLSDGKETCIAGFRSDKLRLMASVDSDTVNSDMSGFTQKMGSIAKDMGKHAPNTGFPGDNSRRSCQKKKQNDGTTQTQTIKLCFFCRDADHLVTQCQEKAKAHAASQVVKKAHRANQAKSEKMQRISSDISSPTGSELGSATTPSPREPRPSPSRPMPSIPAPVEILESATTPPPREPRPSPSIPVTSKPPRVHIGGGLYMNAVSVKEIQNASSAGNAQRE